MTSLTRVSPLDDPFTAALTGPQKPFAQTLGRITRFDPDVSVFYGHPTDLTPTDYVDLAELAGVGHTASVRDAQTPLPTSGFAILDSIELVQYRGDAVAPRADPDLVVLGPADVPEMTALVELTAPGPFLPRTIELGTYLGYRDADGTLLAMAGQRLRLPGWTEISAVCTHPSARGRGLAERLIRAVAQVTIDEGSQPFLHTSGDNPARRLYERMGFVLRSSVRLDILRVTGDPVG